MPHNYDRKVLKLLKRHDGRPMCALYEVLMDASQGIELPMAIIMDPLCGIERRAEEEDARRCAGIQIGLTPLEMALRAGRLDFAEALLAAGADVNSKGSMPLHYAAAKGQESVIKPLQESGTDLEAVSVSGSTPLHCAALNREAGTIKALLDLGASQTAVDNEGRTPLHRAVENDDCVDLIDAFRFNAAAFKANLTAKDKKGRTPLHVARAVPAIKALLDLGANQAAVDSKDRTPLHCAAAGFYISVDLIEAFRCNVTAFKATLTAKDTSGCTPLQLYKPLRSTDDSTQNQIRALLTPK